MIRSILFLTSLVMALAALYDPALLESCGFAAGVAGAMACTPGAGLAGALANGMAGVAADPGAREWILADMVDSSRLALGQQVQARLQSVPQRDSLGRYAHVRGILFAAKGAFTTVDNNVAVGAYLLRSLYQNLHLEDASGHVYFDGIDGRTIIDDQFFRHWSVQQWPWLHAGIEGDVTSGGEFPEITYDYGIQADSFPSQIVDLSLYIPLVSNADGASPLEGIIPLAALQNKGGNALRFNVGQSIPTTPTGVTFTGFRNPNVTQQTTTGMEIWLDVVYLDHPVIDAPWTVEQYTINEQNGQLRYPDRITEYAAIRYFAEDNVSETNNNGQLAVQGLNTFTLTVAGLSKVSGYTFEQMVRRQQLFAATVPDSALSEGSAKRDLPLENPDGVVALILLPQRQRATAPAGRINYNIATDPNDFIRFVHRTVGGQTPTRVNMMTQATSCQPCQFQTPSGASPNLTEPVIAVDKSNV